MVELTTTMEGIEQGTPNSSPAEELISVVEGMDDNAIRNVEVVAEFGVETWIGCLLLFYGFKTILLELSRNESSPFP